jgi:hypothetical protein
MKKIGYLIAFAVPFAASGALAGDWAAEEIFGPYLQRTEGVTLGAGDAMHVNAASQILNPWPRNVRNRLIPANGQRMAGAIQRYQDVKKLREAPPPLSPEAISPSGFSGGTSGR